VVVAPRPGGIRGRSEGHGTRAEAGEKERGLSSQVADVDYARDPGADGGADSATHLPAHVGAGCIHEPPPPARMRARPACAVVMLLAHARQQGAVPVARDAA
jgi:hypothetical protein